ncbi:MAG TPA: hypothetical protein VFX76_04360, partial [Roseiflexaceae bacterium]|nr:hypothetical protein [Roseiflexaceae bacterium]
IFSLLAWSQDSNERRRGRDRQRAHIVLGQKCLETGEQGVIGQSLDRQGGGVTGAGDCATAGASSWPFASAMLHS